MNTATKTLLLAASCLATLPACAELGESFFADTTGHYDDPAPYATPAGQAQTRGAVNAAGAQLADAGNITINGRPVDPQTLELFVETYRVQPMPGDYWYDTVNGMWGRIGMPAEGFLYPGHDFGPLPADASHGTSGVFVNGRVLHDYEVLSLSSYLGYVAPGRYWLDATGNYGYEGYPTAVGNLFALARGGAGGGVGGGGDNAWSTRFSSGNYDSASGAGYVQLPGGGFVTHGM